MAKLPSESDRLLAAIDALSARYASDHPQLVQELSTLRAQLESALKSKNRSDIAQSALRIAGWVRFVIEMISRE